jgi:hypothetical protein
MTARSGGRHLPMDRIETEPSSGPGTGR